jgi:predicted TIM-barrel fold metal-dependent hydrolase
MSGATALGAAALVPATLSAATPHRKPRNPRRIDTHHHYSSPAIKAFDDKYSGGQHPPQSWVLEDDLRDMDANGTQTAILSAFLTPDIGTLEAARKAARENNEFGARLGIDHPGRYGLFATLPMPDVDGSIAEAIYALDTLKADGVTMHTSYGKKWLGDAAFAPLWQELNRRKTVVYTHPPNYPACCRNMIASVPDPVIEYQTDTTRTIASLIFTGTTTRYPDIRFIFSHGGGTMPYLIERFLGNSRAEIEPGRVTMGQRIGTPMVQPPAGALTEVRKMYYDTAQVSNPAALAALRKVVPTSHLLYGTDYWYRTAQDTQANLLASGAFNPQDLRALERGNAERLFPRFAL